MYYIKFMSPVAWEYFEHNSIHANWDNHCCQVSFINFSEYESLLKKTFRNKIYLLLPRIFPISGVGREEEVLTEYIALKK